MIKGSSQSVSSRQKIEDCRFPIPYCRFYGRYSLLSNLVIPLQPVHWARRDKPQRDHYVEICEVVKRKVHSKKGTRSTMQQIPALAQARTLSTGRNDDKEGFFRF